MGSGDLVALEVAAGSLIGSCSELRGAGDSGFSSAIEQSIEAEVQSTETLRSGIWQ